MPRRNPNVLSDHPRFSLSKRSYSSAIMPFDRGDVRSLNKHNAPLYSAEERRRRDKSPWTIVQGVLAPLQFLVFLISLGLVLRYLVTGVGLDAASISILIKTLCLLTIMVTGAIWEKAVFGRYLFARAFFWEDVFSFLVIALHITYCVALFGGFGTPDQQMLIALAAYAAYVINATQFLLKLRAARRDQAANALEAPADFELAQ